MKKLICFLYFLWISALPILANPPLPSPTHGFSLFGKLKYPPDFTHFDYAYPNAPKGGILRLGILGTFDSLNPYIVKGIAPSLISYTAATLLEECYDRAGEAYGYAAEGVEVAPNYSWVIFRLNPKAVFSNGDPITADDIIWVFEVLRTKGTPLYRTYYKNVIQVKKMDQHTIQFIFDTTSNRELPLILGQLPILSKKYYETHKFEETSLTPPPSSGPYQIESLSAGRSIVLKRVENWWGTSLPTQKGRHNFNRIKVDYYLENNTLFQAFIADQYDLHHENISQNWANGYAFPACRKGYVKREELPNSLSGGTSGLFFNARRTPFSDLRVRKALTLMFDFPWINKHLFHSFYQRNLSYYPNSDFAAKGPPSLAEKAILNPFEKDLSAEILTQAFTLPTPQNEEDLRSLQTQALSLLKEAGFEIKDAIMVDSKTNKPFIIEVLTADRAFERVFLNFALSLKRLGIQLKLRTLDAAAYQLRIDTLDYDAIFAGIPQSSSLGNEQRDYFGSERANTPGTKNYAGIKNPIVDQLIEKLINYTSYKSLVTRAQALDRVLLWNYYMIPGWHNNVIWIAYWDRFSRPLILPKYRGLDITTWWFDPSKADKLFHHTQEKNPEIKDKPSLWQKFLSWFSSKFTSNTKK